MILGILKIFDFGSKVQGATAAKGSSKPLIPLGLLFRDSYAFFAGLADLKQHAFFACFAALHLTFDEPGNSHTARVHHAEVL